MSMYIDSEKLIAEIERHIKRYESLDCDDFNSGGLYMCDELLEFIESFQQEQPEAELDKEVQRWKNEHGVVGMDDLWLKFARHFYDIGFNAKKNKV